MKTNKDVEIVRYKGFMIIKSLATNNWSIHRYSTNTFYHGVESKSKAMEMIDFFVPNNGITTD